MECCGVHWFLDCIPEFTNVPEGHSFFLVGKRVGEGSGGRERVGKGGSGVEREWEWVVKGVGGGLLKNRLLCFHWFPHNFLLFLNIP